MKISVRQLVRRFGALLAVDHLSFSFESGHVYGFIGPNGAGKTTTMRIIATLDQPDGGDVLCDGRSVVDYPQEARRLIGFMPDQLPDNRDVTVWEYLDFFLRAAGLQGAERTRRMAELFDFTELGPLRDSYLQQLSKGMKQRVTLARALAHAPRMLVMDEPAAGLDPRARIGLRARIRTLAGQGIGILISSHILADLEDVCDGAIIIDRGRLLSAGPLAQLNDAVGISAPDGVWPIEVVLSGDPDAAGLIAQDLPLVRSARHNGAATLRLEISGGAREAAETVALLIRHGVVVTGFRQCENSLEEVFMKITEGRK